MKIAELKLGDHNAELWIELEGKLVKVGQSYLKMDTKSDQSKLVLIPIKPRQRARLLKKTSEVENE